MGRIINVQALTTQLASTNWTEVGLALLVGTVLGFVFGKLNLPAPAPLVLAGIAGIVGIWLGYTVSK